jgi:hypothetical protein
MESKNFLTVKQLAAKHQGNSENSIRWFIFTQPEGFNECVRRIGRKILLEEGAYLNWLNNQKAA